MNLLSTRLDGCVLRRGLAAACAWLALAGVAGSWTASARGQCTWQELAKLTASDGAAVDQFGLSVALWGDTAVVGAPFGDPAGEDNAGSAYVFVRSGPPGSEVWTEQAKLTASDAAATDVFGYSVAVTGDTAVVGAHQNDDAGDSSGSAYVFVRSGGVWTQQAKLTAADAAEAEWFGYSVAVSGDTAVVGAYRDDHAGSTSGSAYVFIRSGSVWTQQAKLTASDAAALDRFGISVAVSGDTAVVGARLDDHDGGIDAGSAYVFVKPGSGWIDMTETAKLTASDAAADDEFGDSVALSGDTAVVGAPEDDHDGGADAGSAYVFVQPPGGWTNMTETAKLTASDAAANDQFGTEHGVAVSGDTVVVGAWFDDDAGGEDAGSAYLFTRSGAPGSEVWTEQKKLTASDAAAFDDFGRSVAVSGDTVVVGSYVDDNAGGEDAGSAYIFECPSVSGCPVPITAADAAAGDEFGISVAVSGDTAVVGARRDDNASGVDAGSAYVYVKSGPPGSEVWTQQAKLIGTTSDGLVAGSESGIAVAISGDTALVGSWLWPSGHATGMLFVFVRSGPPGSEVWTQQAALQCPQFGSFEYFGYSVALEGDTAVVGSLAAPGLNVGGQAFFYARSGPPGGEFWTSGQKFPSDGVPGDQFGNSVAMSPSQDTAIVGAWLEDNAGGTDAGSAYVFSRTVTPPNGWVEQAKLIASDGTADDRFGVKVAISGDTAVVGAYQDDHAGGGNAGSAYVFTRSGTVWTEQAKLTASDAAAGDAFGVSLSLSGNTVVVGAHGDDHAGGADAGSAYVFTRAGTVWTEQFKLTSPDPAADDWFGVAVALSGDTSVIGARQDDHAGGTNAGSAYVFSVGPACTIFIPPDFDHDSDVDGGDLATFESCASGPAILPLGDCIKADFDGDNDVDQSDFGIFQRCYSGQDKAADPNCA